MLRIDVLAHQKAASLPGSGLILQADRTAWAKALALLPDSISSDANSQFANPKLASALLSFLQHRCKDLSVQRLSEAQYLELLNEDLNPKRVATYLSRVNKIIIQREDNPYHSGFHSRSEVPRRLQTILQNLSDQELKAGSLGLNFSRGILFAAAPTHDLFHAGVGYAQRLTPGLNISNEERAVLRMVELAFDAGFNPLQVFEMQRVILPTSFYQKPSQLGTDKDPQAQIKYLNHTELPAASFPKAHLERDYDPDKPGFEPSRKMAQVLALADVCVTLGSLEQWIDRSLMYYIEVKVGQGNYPTSVQQFVQDELNFLNEHLTQRLEACRTFLSKDFYSWQVATMNEFAERLFGALRHPKSADGILLADAVTQLQHHQISSGPNLDGLMDF